MDETPGLKRESDLLSYRDLESRQGEPTQTNRDHWGSWGPLRAFRGPITDY